MAQPTDSNPLSPTALADLVPARIVLENLHTNQRNLKVAVSLGTFPRPIKLGNQLFWHQADLLAWIENQRATPKAATHGDADATTTTPSGVGGGVQ
jgi:hypothetical protein